MEESRIELVGNKLISSQLYSIPSTLPPFPSIQMDHKRHPTLLTQNIPAVFINLYTSNLIEFSVQNEPEKPTLSAFPLCFMHLAFCFSALCLLIHLDTNYTCKISKAWKAEEHFECEKQFLRR